MTSEKARPARGRGLERPHPTTLLVVDHEPAVLRLLRYLLVSAGYSVIEARTDEEAIARLEASPLSIDLLLVDVEVPGTDRQALIRYVRGQAPATRILYMSSLSEEELGRAGHEGAAVVQKPLGASSLVRRIRDFLDDPWG